MDIEEIVKAIIDFVNKNYKNEVLVAPYIWEKYRDELKLLISIVLSIRTREENTLKASECLFSKFKDLKEILTAKEEDLEECIRITGLYKQKIKWIREIVRKYFYEFNGKLPDGEELLKLPGVGRKVLNVFLIIARGKNIIAVDTHVHRVANRLGLVNTKTLEKTEKELYKVVPEKYWKLINYYFVVFGRNVCKPLKPRCNICPVRNYCQYYNKIKKKT